jgi:predicted Fe-Mo cluster-binding NifX family protein
LPPSGKSSILFLRKEYDAMKIAVTSTGPSLDDPVEVRFGRCRYFLVVDPTTMETEVIQNPYIDLGGGAGIQSAQLLADKGVTAVLTGNCGPNAFRVFSSAGIKVISGISGKVRDAVERYKSGAVAGASAPSVQSHFGMGRGTGRGMGTGGGRGMGRGLMRSREAETTKVEDAPTSSSPESTGRQDEISELKEQAKALKKQMEQITARLKDLEG